MNVLGAPDILRTFCSKNQQAVRDICDQVLNGQGVGVFMYGKMKRLMEDESLRELVCSKLNLGLDLEQFNDEDAAIPDIVCLTHFTPMTMCCRCSRGRSTKAT